MVTTKAVRVTPASAPKPRNVAEYISWQIQLCGKSQTEIAQQAGFDKPNVITMIKQGKTKVPLAKIAVLAKALEIDPVYFFRLVVGEYMPDLMEIIQQITGGTIVSKNELEFLEVIRSAKVPNPKLRTDTEKRKLREFVDSLKGDNETN